MNKIFTPNVGNAKGWYSGTVPNTPEGLAYIKELRKTKSVRLRGRNPNRKSLVEVPIGHPSFKYLHMDARRSVKHKDATHFAVYVTDKLSQKPKMTVEDVKEKIRDYLYGFPEELINNILEDDSKISMDIPEIFNLVDKAVEELFKK